VINHLIRLYALSWHPTLWHMIYVAQWLLLTYSSSVTLGATQVVWTQMMATWDMWYIDEGFLIWIIPLTYRSCESIIWAYTTGFVHTCIYRMFNVFIACLFVLKLSTLFSMHAFWFRLIDVHVFTWFRIYCRSFNFFYVTYHCLCPLNDITWSCTRVSAWARHLALSYVLVGLHLTTLNSHI